MKNQNSSQNKVAFLKPIIIAFVGIPCSGKSTITRELSKFLDSQFYLEPEESNYPNNIKENFSRIKEHGSALNVYKYFRNIRARNLFAAEKKKMKGISSVLDCFYDKIVVDILGNPETDCFVDSKSEDFKKILKIAKEDSLSLPHIDLLFFLRLNSKELHDDFLQERGRKLDVSSEIYQAQEIFLKASSNYSRKNSTKFVIIEQGKSIENTIHKIILSLEKEKIIKLSEFSRVALQAINFPNHFLLVNNKKGGWNFPGGKVENDEEPIDAAKREVFEETNLLVENLQEITENVFLINGKWWKGYFYQANNFSGEIVNKELDKILDISFKSHDYILNNKEINDITKCFLTSL